MGARGGMMVRVRGIRVGGGCDVELKSSIMN